MQGRHARQDRQDLGLAWSLQNRTWLRQRWHHGDVVAAKAVLPAKNLTWHGGPGMDGIIALWGQRPD